MASSALTVEGRMSRYAKRLFPDHLRVTESVPRTWVRCIFSKQSLGKSQKTLQEENQMTQARGRVRTVWETDGKHGRLE